MSPENKSPTSKGAAPEQQSPFGSLPFSFGNMPAAAGKMEFKMQVSWKPDTKPASSKLEKSKMATKLSTSRKRQLEEESTAVAPTAKKARKPAKQTAGRKGKAAASMKKDCLETTRYTESYTPHQVSSGRLMFASDDHAVDSSHDSSYAPPATSQKYTSATDPTSYKYDSKVERRNKRTEEYGSSPSTRKPPKQEFSYQNNPSPSPTKHTTYSNSSVNTRKNPLYEAQLAYQSQIEHELETQNDAPPSYEQSCNDYHRQPTHDDNPSAAGYIFTFGKYRGASFGEIAAHDPGYLDWCYRDNVRSDGRELRETLERWRAENDDCDEESDLDWI